MIGHTYIRLAASVLGDIHDSRDTTIMNAQSGLTLSDVVAKTIGLINSIIPVLFTLALVFFMWTAVRYVTQAGEGGGEVRGQLLWGVIALFVIFSVWGLVNILCYTFLGVSCGR